jgi:hypothetical protein
MIFRSLDSWLEIGSEDHHNVIRHWRLPPFGRHPRIRSLSLTHTRLY